MKVIVDWDLCEANAVCMKVCPEVFELQEDDTLLIKDEQSAGEPARQGRRSRAALPAPGDIDQGIAYSHLAYRVSPIAGPNRRPIRDRR